MFCPAPRFVSPLYGIISGIRELASVMLLPLLHTFDELGLKKSNLNDPNGRTVINFFLVQGIQAINNP